MLKIACISLMISVAAVAAQTNSLMTYMMLNSMMDPSAAGGAAAAAGASGATPSGLGAAAAAAAAAGMSRGGSNPMASMLAAGGSGASRGIMAAMNNPMLMCRQTENFRPIPCRNNPDMCNFESIRNYKLPNLLTCSPMGFGCCIKDAMTLMFINRHA